VDAGDRCRAAAKGRRGVQRGDAQGPMIRPFFNIFAEKNLQKIWRFRLKAKAKLCKNFEIALAFEKNVNL
jgi:hypothetical protein